MSFYSIWLRARALSKSKQKHRKVIIEREILKEIYLQGEYTYRQLSLISGIKYTTLWAYLNR